MRRRIAHKGYCPACDAEYANLLTLQAALTQRGSGVIILNRARHVKGNLKVTADGIHPTRRGTGIAQPRQHIHREFTLWPDLC